MTSRHASYYSTETNRCPHNSCRRKEAGFLASSCVIILQISAGSEVVFFAVLLSLVLDGLDQLIKLFMHCPCCQLTRQHQEKSLKRQDSNPGRLGRKPGLNPINVIFSFN